MHWFQTLDVGLFRFVNQALSNPVFDVLMPFASGNRFFVPVALLVAGLLLWKGAARGRLCLLMLLLIVWPGDSLISNTLKHAVARPRPFVTLPEVRLFGRDPRLAVQADPQVDRARSMGGGGYTSMPSSHAANWFAATLILLVYYRRSWRFMLPLACLVSFSRVYNGVHYPSDVVAGAILGAGYAAAGMLAFNALWQWIGRRWFPLWWEQLPSLLNLEGERLKTEPETRNSRLTPQSSPPAPLDLHWLRLGYLLIGVMLLLRLVYIGSGLIELSGDEAYQWLWSKHPALSYYSKPPLIAYTQFLGTYLWGDTEFGVRFFSPVVRAVVEFLLLRLFAREVNARAGVVLLLIIATTPMMAPGSVLMTVDPLSVLFWTAAMVAGWRAAQPGGNTASWLWTGLWMGLGFLSKYTELFQWLCWIVFFILWKPARSHLRRPGPCLALLVNLACAAPVLIWNWQHQWITVHHVADDAAVGAVWHPTLRYFFDFLGKEAALLNPFFFVAVVWAAAVFWRRSRHDPRLVYLFSMGAPLFLSYLLYTFHSRVLPNWIAPSVLPLFCLGVIYWDTRWRMGFRAAALTWLIGGLAFGVPLVALLHDTNLIQKVVGHALPPKSDPMTRVRGYRTMAAIVNEARIRLAGEGKPVFIVADHYGIAGQISFYLPEARTNVVSDPLVYYLSSPSPMNQFYYWPGYQDRRKGQNAVFVRELSEPPLVQGWVGRWLAGEKNLRCRQPRGEPLPTQLLKEFDSVTDLGLFDVPYRDRIFHTLQLFECRNLK
jgi:membrane-associated phospholipid phosphatase